MLRLALTVAFLVVPLLEILVIISVGQVIGGWQTVGLLFAMSVLGTYLVRREGASAWRELQKALGAGRLPSRELADAALVLVGGTLLLTPGFLTDVVGFFLILPFTRPLARRLLTGLLVSRLPVVTVMGLPRMGAGSPGQRTHPGQYGRTTPPGPGGGARGGRVVEGEVIRDDETGSGGPGGRPSTGDEDGAGSDRGPR